MSFDQEAMVRTNPKLPGNVVSRSVRDRLDERRVIQHHNDLERGVNVERVDRPSANLRRASRQIRP
jgi:hypothetical protein